MKSLASFRGQHGGPGRRIPEAFWSKARELARVHGVAQTRALRLDAERLAELVEVPSSGEPAAFVELGGLDVGERSDAAGRPRKPVCVASEPGMS